MNFNKLISITLVIVLNLFSGILIAKDQFQVTADIINSSTGVTYLKMTVWNCSDKSASLESANLPWGEHSLGLVAYPAGKLADEPLKESFGVEDFSHEDVIVSPMSSISGQINLSNHFPSLRKFNIKNNIVIFWVYDLSLLAKSESKLSGGMIPIDENIVSPSKKYKSCKDF